MALAEVPTQLTGLDYFYEIAAGSGKDLELDKGGYWSPKDQIWVDGRFRQGVEAMTAQERKFVEVMANAGTTVGGIFHIQGEDASTYRMWPEEIFGENGGERVVEAARDNPGVYDPYSLLVNGLDHPALSYSQAYREFLPKLMAILRQASTIESPSAKNHQSYFLALQAAFDADSAKSSDLADMRIVDRTWIDISADSPLLVLVEPTEVYYDPARLAISQQPQVAKWANQVTDLIGVPPWRAFFEFRLLAKDESMVSVDEIGWIREASRNLFKIETDEDVPVSTEFRRLLLASGNGAHPAKTAKNYPNFEDIRGTLGYKNVLYSNMIEEGVRTLIVPVLYKAFGTDILDNFSEEELIRGRALGVLAHEENHPFRIFRDTPLEELKATVDGLYAVLRSGKFSTRDTESMIVAEVGAMLYVHNQLEKARETSDTNTIKAMEAYARADTLMMNFLMQSEAIMTNPNSGDMQIDYEKFALSLEKLVEKLNEVRTGDVSQTIPQFYNNFEDNHVWINFRYA
jgi:hypothetical protein